MTYARLYHVRLTQSGYIVGTGEYRGTCRPGERLYRLEYTTRYGDERYQECRTDGRKAAVAWARSFLATAAPEMAVRG